MARRDGIPTNYELQDELGAVGASLFKTAFANDVERGFSSKLDGKRLTDVDLVVVGFNDPMANFRFQQLRIGAVSTLDLIGYGVGHKRFERQPLELDERIRIARGVGDIVLGADIQLDALDARSFETMYRAQRAGSTRETFVGSVVSDKPVKNNLLLALDFAEEIVLPHFRDNHARRDISRRFFGFVTDAQIDGPVVYDTWRLNITSSLPLNGKEGSEFLLGYEAEALERIAQYSGKLDQLKQLGATKDPAYEYYGQMVADWQGALQRVSIYLGR